MKLNTTESLVGSETLSAPYLDPPSPEGSARAVSGIRSTCAGCRLSSQRLPRLQPFNLIVREWRASNLHSTDFSRRNQVGDICDSKVPLLNRWEKLFESAGTARGNDHCEVNRPIVDGLPGMGNAGRKRDDISCVQDPAKVRTPHRNCAFSDLENFVLNRVEVARRPETSRGPIIENAKAVVRFKAESPDAGHFAPGSNGKFAQTFSPANDRGFRCVSHALIPY